jgi:hypothetical protein
MPSISRRLADQRGVSLVEAVVASALMGIGVVAGITAWDTASLSAGKALRLAWGSCIVRSELDAVFAAPYAGSYPVSSPFDADGTVQVTVADVPGRGGEEQQVTVQAFDPQSHVLLGQLTALKASALAGNKSMDSYTLNDVKVGCPAR